jgi:hypothetical protein
LAREDAVDATSGRLLIDLNRGVIYGFSRTAQRVLRDYMLGMYVRSFAQGLVGLAAATAVLAGSAGVACAADNKPKPLDFTVRTDVSAIAPHAPTVKWDAAKGKWGVTLNMQQPDTRASTWNDVQAGAYYRITPSLRVGGAFALGDQQPLPGPKPSTPEAGQPRVQLETKFKF